MTVSPHAGACAIWSKSYPHLKVVNTGGLPAAEDQALIDQTNAIIQSLQG